MINSFLKFKHDVPEDTLQPIMKAYLFAIAYIHYNMLGIPLIVTSTTDGKHKNNSLHYKGLAFDVRTFDKTTKQLSSFVDTISTNFNNRLDIVIESNHLHIEYDPH